MHKQPNITDETKQNFINAFIILNQKKPIEKITVKELTVLAGYNRCTFYRYFSDIYAILETIETEILQDTARIIMANHNGQTFNNSIIEAFSDLHEKNRNKLQVVLNPTNRFHFIEVLKKELIPIFECTFLPNQSSMSSMRSAYLFDIFFTSIITILSRWLYCQNEIEKAELTNIADSFLRNWLLKELTASPT